jgi:flagellar biosynthesis/type III secretory pathway chaperone
MDFEEASMANEDKDKSVLNHIDQLVKEEERLYGKGQLNVDDQKRLADLKVQLDQYWDLLRQRRALEEFGENPDKAKKRPAKIVENYEQ